MKKQRKKERKFSGKKFDFLGRYMTKSEAEVIKKRNKRIGRNVRIVKGKDCSVSPCSNDYRIFYRDTQKTKQLIKMGLETDDKYLQYPDKF